MAEARSSLSSDLRGNPFAGFGELMLETVELQWGWAVLILGAALIIAAAAIKEKKPA